ncbi:MAG TPA: sugar-transfer associated ATP-grasp domain-containing protein [Woeseiaceae bacterium]|nr:sugar-transfer associated ATP-grasp domain-containing protein [Woeseiaceae bacterium]
MSGTFRQRFTDKVLPYCRAALQHKSLPSLLFDMARHQLSIATSPADYLRYEFYKGERSMAEKKRYLSKRGSHYFPWNKNPVSQLALFDNKLLFKKFLLGCGIDQAKLLATIGPQFELCDRASFCDWLGTLRQDVVFKPTLGSGGQGIRLLTCSGDGLRERDKMINADTLWRELRQIPDAAYIVEERLRNRADIAAFNPGCLNTLRIVTIRTDDDTWHISLVALRVGSAHSAVDNLAAGGTTVKFSADGVGVAAYDWTQKCMVERHADSGLPLVGFALGQFDAICQLALAWARHFPDMGAIGWDIALTDTGPKVVEANPYFDSWYFQMGSMGPLLTDAVAAGLTPRRLFAAWDRRYISPRLKRHRIHA